MTPYPMQAGGSAVLIPARRAPRPLGAPPPPPPGGSGRGGGGGGGDGEEAAHGGGAGEVGRFALVLVLAGISTLFLVLIAVWLFLRRPAPDWRAESGPALEALWLSTLCLAASSAAVERAARLAPRGTAGQVRAWLAGSILLGLAFLGAQLGLWWAVWRAGLVPASSGYAAVFFALTGLHALHVLGGLGFLAALRRRLRRESLSPERAASVRLAAVYWHFMGALWLVLFTLLYFVR